MSHWLDDAACGLAQGTHSRREVLRRGGVVASGALLGSITTPIGALAVAVTGGTRCPDGHHCGGTTTCCNHDCCDNATELCCGGGCKTANPKTEHCCENKIFPKTVKCCRHRGRDEAGKLCGSHEKCCNGDCCESEHCCTHADGPQKCCQKPATQCCEGHAYCCKPGEKCCGYTSHGRKGTGGSCCPPDVECCGEINTTCCEKGQICCGKHTIDATCCDPSNCVNGLCCPNPFNFENDAADAPRSVGCNGQCCKPGDMCCGSGTTATCCTPDNCQNGTCMMAQCPCTGHLECCGPYSATSANCIEPPPYGAGCCYGGVPSSLCGSTCCPPQLGACCGPLDALYCCNA